MRALQIFAGPRARESIAQSGLAPQHVRTMAAAAGGPKGLILGALDRFIFGEWLNQSEQTVDLVGASIGAWRMATACLPDSIQGFKRLEHDYVHQHYETLPGQKRPTAQSVSESFGRNLRAFYDGQVAEVLSHPRYRLNIVTTRGRHVLATEHRLRTPLGYFGAFVTNAMHRKAMGAWLERVVFSSGPPQLPLPFGTSDYRTRRVALSTANFSMALQASCSIPFVLQAVHGIPGAPPGAYWDGGITDYHLHLNYPFATQNEEVVPPAKGGRAADLVLYPHFQKAVVPGWLDKGLRWRHRSTHFLDTMVLLAPNPEWVKTLPNSKLPDRADFTHYSNDLAGRMKAWTTAISASAQLADEFAAWTAQPDVRWIHPI
ncbi:phospholipase [Rhodoferax aquaticus]|uniref:Phospholipase n=1 Tax=Rhodoferax aquaticus TaxID=2527691 RepID=A0A515EPQ4_9BURK|nr:phospholipase [Rhodoferax aquaticus]QDL54636.1 phospholipase [Rhodoferax aquaticus]